MKYLSEFRDPSLAKALLAEIHTTVTRPWTLMEVCGGQTHAIVRSGIDQLLPSSLHLVHGPGCPVCVTPISFIDKAINLAARPEIILTTFGDMMRVPGSIGNLLEAKSRGNDVRMVYSVLEAISLAQENPHSQIVFFGVGFETTAPGNAMAILQAQRLGLDNFSILACHVLVPPALRALLDNKENKVDGYLAAGNVCTIMGLEEYQEIVDDYKVPIVATGLEPVDILAGILDAVRQLEKGEYRLENEYKRSVTPTGNLHARKIIDQIFRRCDRNWRGIGVLSQSGLAIRDQFAAFDAEHKFQPQAAEETDNGCMAGQVLQGLLKPPSCPFFGNRCKPEHPLGATMVSGEGACAAYYKYHRLTT
ncbi:MAG: hydrogenase formation protein HypD [Proteobacteria bacterium]|nr:hydrogenase formation protein HypD [Pseudomonadota bacterium]MBU1639368.1 hydrogenase formation protein HypD [Pseudomonadota bacterium]